MPRHRLFFGLQPPAPVLASLRAAAAQLQADGGPGGRSLPPEKLHLTLAFLGDFDDEGALRRALEAGAQVEASGFDFTLDQATSWGARQPLWVFTGVAAPFADLHASLLRCLHAQGLHADDEARAFVPHVTWLRNARQRLARTAIAPIAWPARDFVLYDSREGQYDVLARWPLGDDLA
jgi:2'-5' RNA ligase